MQFVNETTERFKDGLASMLAERSDTFSFEFPLSAVPGWELREEAVRAGLEPHTSMTLMVLVRPKESADALLTAMAELRGADVVDVLEAGKD